MATAKLNPLIKSISGRMGNVVFYRNRNTQCIRRYVIPRNPDTESQREVRRNFAVAVKAWQVMSPDEKYAYTRKAGNTGMSGYNLFISIFLKGRIIRENKYNAVSRDYLFADKNKELCCAKHIYRNHSVSLPFLLQYSISNFKIKLE